MNEHRRPLRKNLEPLVQACLRYLNGVPGPVVVDVLLGLDSSATRPHQATPWFGKARHQPRADLEEAVARLSPGDGPSDPAFLSVSQVARKIQAALRPALADTFWVKAELSNVSVSGSNYYFDLLESARGKALARLRASLFSEPLRRIRQRFQAANLTFEPGEGTLVGLHCRLSFDPVHGLRLQVLDADPDVALGELERRRQALLEKIRREGLDRLNRERPLPLIPQRIGLITSRDSAACQDFLRTLKESPYGIQVLLADARVQGKDAPGSIIAALRHLKTLDLDLVVLVRGGGSRTDLADLDNESLARAIAHYSCPVWTGIGHETDTSLIDYVSARYFRTPTAAAQGLVELYAHLDGRLQAARRALQRIASASLGRLRQGQTARHQLFAAQARGSLERQQSRLRERQRRLTSVRLDSRRQRLQERSRRLREAAGRRLERHRERGHQWRARLQVPRLLERLGHLRAALARQSSSLRAALASQLQVRQAALEGGRLELRRCADRALEREGWKSALRERTLRAGDPFSRGFALLTSAQGSVIRSIAEVEPGQVLHARVADGYIQTLVERTEPLDESDGGHL